MIPTAGLEEKCSKKNIKKKSSMSAAKQSVFCGICCSSPAQQLLQLGLMMVESVLPLDLLEFVI